MTSKILLQTIKKIVTVCRKQKVKIAIMGGIAASVFGRPRATYDVDGFILIEEANLKRFLSSLSAAGFSYDKKRPIKKIQGMSFLTLVYSKLKVFVDLFIVTSGFHKDILKRIKKINFDGMVVPLVSAEDLILLKLLSGRERDVEDVREIIMENKRELDFGFLKKWAKKLRVLHFLNDELESLGI